MVPQNLALLSECVYEFCFSCVSGIFQDDRGLDEEVVKVVGVNVLGYPVLVLHLFFIRLGMMYSEYVLEIKEYNREKNPN